MAPQPVEPSKALTVTELTRGIKSVLADRFGDVLVRGEISGLKQAASGHIYFTLKDPGAVINCVMWRGVAGRYRKDMKDGQEVVVLGKLDLYEPRGSYNLVVSHLELLGAGSLQQQFEKLKAKLDQEGLFDERRKKPIPKMPHVIGVVTSPTGAAVRDILTTVYRRFPALHVILYGAKVQGEGAKEEIAAGIRHFNEAYAGRMDVMIVGRGGGSLEDLWAFNEELVARAIFASRIPIISAVGHEVDFTIADFVADLRAATPTAAAELAVPDRRQLLANLDKHKLGLVRGLRGRAGMTRSRLDAIRDGWAFRSIVNRVQDAWRHLDEAAGDMSDAMRERLREGRERLALHAAHLQELSPLNIMARGYSVGTVDGKLLKSVDQVKPGTTIQTRLRDGLVEATVKDAKKL